MTKANNRLNHTFGGDTTGSNKRQVDYTANTLNQYTQRSYPGYVEVNGIANPSDTLFVGGNNPTWQGNNFWQELGFDNSWSAIQTNIDIWDISATATNYIGYEVLLPKNPETLTYDLDGNLTQDSQWNYTWNAENKLVHMQNGTGESLDYAYDLQGRRISKVVTVNSTITSSKKFYYDGWNIIGEVDSATSTGISYNWGLDLSQSLQGAGGVGGLISMTISGSQADGTYVYQYDGNGNVIGLVDMGGNQAAQYEYGPFGETVMASGYEAGLNSFGFATKSKDVETGLSFYPARPGYPGMWISRDPSEENSGANLYNFCNNDGVNFVDPAGLALYAFDGTGNDGRQLPDGMGTAVYILWKSHIGEGVYEPGVGSSFGTRTIGGAFGLGATARVEDAYKQFTQIYNQGKGDTDIDIIGFSRGAAEAREFANLIYKRGDGSGMTITHSVYGKNTITQVNWGTPCNIPNIRFVGLFDTVATSLHSFNLNLPPNVQLGRQAKAKDERRYFFPVTSILPSLPGQNLDEQWFPGDHSDIGHNHLTKNNDLVWEPLDYIRNAGVSVGVPFGPLPYHKLTGDTKPHDLTGTFPFVLIPITSTRH